MNLEYLIDEIERIQSEATVNVIESMIDYNDKMEVIQECVNDNPDMYSDYFQEGAIDNVKMKGKSDSNKLVTAIKFIPRLIIELIKQAKLKLKRHPENLSKDEVEHVHKICEQCLNKKSTFDKIKEKLAKSNIDFKMAAINTAGAASLVAFCHFKIRDRKNKNFAKFLKESNPEGTDPDKIVACRLITSHGKTYVECRDLDNFINGWKDFDKFTKSTTFKNLMKPDVTSEEIDQAGKEIGKIYKKHRWNAKKYTVAEAYKKARLLLKITSESEPLNYDGITNDDVKAIFEDVDNARVFFMIDNASSIINTLDAISKADEGSKDTKSETPETKDDTESAPKKDSESTREDDE